MKDRFRRSALIALATTAFGLLCCLGVFFFLWGNTAGRMLMPWIVFAVAFLAALPVCLLLGRRRR